jgi:hypothetical protein
MRKVFPDNGGSLVLKGAMAAINKFLRSVPPALLARYFRENGFELATAVDWEQERPILARQLIQLVAELDFASRGRFIMTVGRVAAMSDEAGQVALYAAASNQSALDDLPGGYARAMHLFLADKSRFRRAEAMRYTDDRRFGRIWNGFQCQAHLAPHLDGNAAASFSAAIRASFDTDQVFVDIHERTRCALESEPADLVQVDIYRDDKIDEEWFLEQGAVDRRTRRKVIEAAVTYEPGTGIIECCCSDKKTRAAFVKLFAEHFLGMPAPVPMGRFRHYDLRPLLVHHAFSTDPKDGIASVKVTMLKMMPHDTNAERLTLDVASSAATDIWATAERRFGATNPMNGGWSITHARLSIRFHAHPDGRPERTLPVTISMPSGCDLKDRTDDERIIGERYLRRWGLKVGGL